MDLANTLSKASQSQATPLPQKNPFEEVLWPTMWAKLDANPTTQAYLQNNDFVRIMHELHSTYLKDKRVIQALGVLMNINFWTPTSADAEMPQSLSSLSLLERKRGMKAEPAEELDPMELKVEEGMDKDSQACKEWKLGNAALAKNDFSTAIAHYTNVLELDSKNILCLINRATTYLEMGQVWQFWLQNFLDRTVLLLILILIVIIFDFCYNWIYTLIGIILLVIMFAFGYISVLNLYWTGLMNVSIMFVRNLNSVAPSLVSNKLKNKDWWSYLGSFT